MAEVHWLLARGYQVHCKDYAGTRAKRLAESVTEWRAASRLTGRHVGWVGAPATYCRPAWGPLCLAGHIAAPRGWGLELPVTTHAWVKLVPPATTSACPSPIFWTRLWGSTRTTCATPGPALSPARYGSG